MKDTHFSRRPLIIAGILLLAAASFLIFSRHGAEREQSSAAAPQDAPANEAPPGDVATKSNEARQSPRQADRFLEAEGAKTDVSLSTFPRTEYQQLRSPNGKAHGAPAGEAYIHVPSAARRIAMEPNQIGEFPAVETKLNDTVGIRLSMDGVKSDTPVRLVIMDGGSFPSSQGATKLLKSAKWGGVAFEFTTSGNIGFHRVLVQAQGQPSRILNFNAADGETWPPRDTASTR
jgi:hypothetical protein